MFCPKCKFTTFDHLPKCPKCSYDWSDARKKLNLDWLIEPAGQQGQGDQSHLQLVKSGQQAAEQSQEQGELFEGVLSDGEEQSPSPVVEEAEADTDAIELEPEEETPAQRRSSDAGDNNILDLGSLEEEEDDSEGEEAGEITVDEDISFPELDEMMDEESSGDSGSSKQQEAGKADSREKNAQGGLELETEEAAGSSSSGTSQEEDSDFDEMEDISSLIDDIFPEDEKKGSDGK
jgi:hypothetical protein